MAGWKIEKLPSGSHVVTHVNVDTGEHTLAGKFGPEVPVEEVINELLDVGQLGDWIITPKCEPILVWRCSLSGRDE